MRVNGFVAQTLRGLRMTAASLAVLQMSVGPALAQAPVPAFGGFGGFGFPGNGPGKGGSGQTATPIKHVIVIIGENRSFDHVFATYVPQRGQTVHNLLSEGIVALDSGKNAVPGPNFDKAHQLAALDSGTADTFLLSPPKQIFPDDQLPAPLTGGPSGTDAFFSGANPCDTSPAISALQCAQQTESGLASIYYPSLITGGTGQSSHVPDARISNVNNLPAGPLDRKSVV